MVGESFSIGFRTVMTFRLTPLATNGISPAEILLGRMIRCRLDFMHAPPKSSSTSHRSFKQGEHVFIRNYGSGDKWVPGTVQSAMGEKMCTVELPNGATAERHFDQLRSQHGVPINNIQDTRGGQKVKAFKPQEVPKV